MLLGCRNIIHIWKQLFEDALLYAYRDNIACERISNKAQSIMGIVEDVKKHIYKTFFYLFFFIWLGFSVYIFLLRFKIKPLSNNLSF